MDLAAISDTRPPWTKFMELVKKKVELRSIASFLRFYTFKITNRHGICDTWCVDPEFLKGDANTKGGGGGATYYFCRFPENCMKLKKNWTGGVSVIPGFPTRLENLENLEKWELIFQ